MCTLFKLSLVLHTGDSGRVSGCPGVPQLAVICVCGSVWPGSHRFGGSGPGVHGECASMGLGKGRLDGRRRGWGQLLFTTVCWGSRELN